MKKMIVIAGLMLVSVFATAQKSEVVETILYKNGVETITKAYTLDDVDIIEVWVDGALANTTKMINGLSVTVGFTRHKTYGQYIAANVIVSNNGSDTFHVVPKRNIQGFNIDSKGKMHSFLTQKEYEKIVTRRQNGNAFLMAMAQGLAAMNDGVTTVQTNGSINTNSSGGGSFNAYNNYGTSVYGSYRYSGSSRTNYSSTTRIYNATEARIARQERAQQMSNFIDAQSQAFQLAGDAYLKANTLEPGMTTGGHVLISTRGLSKKNIATTFVINVNGIDFEYKARFINLK